jgi:hypothetical protein
MLGRLIRVNARLFLRVLRDQHRPVMRLDSLVGNFGAAYVDRDAARRYEAARRRAALRAVTDRDLASVRDECLVALKGDGP